MRCEPAQCRALVPTACQASHTFREVSRSPSATANLHPPVLLAAGGYRCCSLLKHDTHLHMTADSALTAVHQGQQGWHIHAAGTALYPESLHAAQYLAW